VEDQEKFQEALAKSLLHQLLQEPTETPLFKLKNLDQREELMEFMTMLPILQLLLESFQPVWELTLMFQKLIALTEKPQSAMVEEQMVFQM
jgi:hypothetical protein